MNELANARNDAAFRENRMPNFNWQAAHGSFSAFLAEVYLAESQKDSFLRENQCPGRNFLHLCNILWRPGETFLSAFSSIQAQLFTGLLKARFRKNPAVAAAGL